MTLRAPEEPVTQIARGLALDYADSAFEPKFAQHVPRVSHVIAVVFSRRDDPARRTAWQTPALNIGRPSCPSPLEIWQRLDIAVTCHATLAALVVHVGRVRARC